MRTSKNICFECRLCFHDRAGTRCPGCQGPLLTVGDFFRAPRRRDVKAWARIRACVKHRTEDRVLLVFPKGPMDAKARKAKAKRDWATHKWKREARTCRWCQRTFKNPVTTRHILACDAYLRHAREVQQRAAFARIGETIGMAVKAAIDFEGFKRKVLRV